MKSDIIVYCTHPVAPRVKAMIRANGHRILDARFAPEGAQIFDGQLGSDAKAEAKAREQGNPDNVPTREAIAKMPKAEVVEWLEAHGVEGVEGKVADLREKLTAIMFADT